ncbi:GlsB/YeaQ/YmgE family stress response membrane protein, partial [Streptococcus pseudopneumoniae]|nr:GlsB/YeaQ/YmgE family stress response membrane protein [Streptococcus pseudopneumoniae]
FNKDVSDSWFLMIITATVGACILLWIVGAITGRKK